MCFLGIAKAPVAGINLSDRSTTGALVISLHQPANTPKTKHGADEKLLTHLIFGGSILFFGATFCEIGVNLFHPFLA